MEKLSMLLRRPVALKGAIWGVILLASEPIIWVLDWAGRLELLKGHLGGAVMFVENPIAVIVTWFGGFVILAAAVRSGSKSPSAPPDKPVEKSLSVPVDDWVPLSHDEYLSDRDSELGFAVRHMAWDSAWGRWYSAQQLASHGHPDEWSLMNTAGSIVAQELMDGSLAARGRTASAIAYEPISRETWRLAVLQVHADVGSLWKFKVVPRSDVDPARISALLGYDSILVDTRQFLSLWPTKDAVHDVGRRYLLEQAKLKNVDSAQIERLSWER